MQYSYQWLKNLSGTKKSPEQLARILIKHAFEVESIEKFSHTLHGVTVGQVVKLEKHPNADSLQVAQVEIGKNEIRHIVCGAKNIALDQKVAVALPGAILPDGKEIAEARLRGVVSQGMICSLRELGMGEDHAGIAVLPPETPLGVDFAKYFQLEDHILDIKILPDRGSDAIAYQGLAREIAALDGHAPRFVEKTIKPIHVPAYNRAPKVSVEDRKGCPRYLGISFKDVALCSRHPCGFR
jgi:phenylalanyl-tRNA synthetase beta chain